MSANEGKRITWHARWIRMITACAIIGCLLIVWQGGKTEASPDPIDQSVGVPDSQTRINVYGQSFTAGRTGYLYDLELYMFQVPGGTSPLMITVQILEGQNMNGAVLGTATFDARTIPLTPGGWMPAWFKDGVYMEAGRQYTIKMIPESTSPLYVWKLFLTDVYAEGDSYYPDQWGRYGEFGFRTYIASTQRDYSTQLAAAPAGGTYGQSIPLQATLTNMGNPVASQTIRFFVDDAPVGTAKTNAAGTAALPYSVTAGPGNHTVKVSYGGDSLYASSEGTTALTVTPKPLTITADSKTKIYGDPVPVLTASYSGLASWDTPASIGGLTLSTAATTSSSVGQYAIQAYGAVSSNYSISYVNSSLTVTKAPLSVTTSNATRVYGDPNPLFDSTVTGLRSGDSVGFTNTTPATITSMAGVYPISVSLVGSRLSNYVITETPGTLTVTPAPLTVVSNSATRMYGNANPAFSGTITGLRNNDAITVSYNSSATAAADVGAYPIGIALHDPSGKLVNYQVTEVKGTLTVTKATLTVKADNATRVYGEPNSPFTGSLSGMRNGDVLGAMFSSSATAYSDAGSYAITAAAVDYSGGKLANYDVAATPGTLMITKAPLSVKADDAARVYGDANPTFTGTVTGLKNGDAITAAYTTTADSASVVGTYEITSALSDAGGKLVNYDVTATPGTLTITKAPLSVKADDAARVYGDANPSFTGTVTGLKNSDAITAAYTTAASAGSGAGTYEITSALNDVGGKLANYDVATTPGTLTITKVTLMVAANDAARVYGDANPSFTGTVTGLKNGDAITASYTTTAGVGSKVGTYGILSSLNDPDSKLSNYNVASTPGTLTITQAPLTVTANDAERTYGETNPSFTGTVTGLKNGDAITAAYMTTADSTSGVGTYDITSALNGAGDKLANYDVTSNTGTLTITKAALTVKAGDAARVYGEANPAFAGTVTGLKNGDAITATYATAADAASSVGTYEITSALNDVGGKLSNYVVTSTSGTLTITQAPLTVMPNEASRWVNQPNPLLSGQIDGLIGADRITASYSTDAHKDSAVGQYVIKAMLADPSHRLDNYTVTVTPAQLTVYTAPRPALANGDQADSVTGHLTLPAADEAGHAIRWTSSNASMIDPATGQVKRPSNRQGDVQVTLQASVEANDTTYTAEYTVTVKAADLTDAESVEADLDRLAIGYAPGDDETKVKGQLKLPASGANGTAIVWTSSDPAVIQPLTGAVTRPSFDRGDTEVVLEATVTKGTEAQHRTFRLKVISEAYDEGSSRPSGPATSSNPKNELYIEMIVEGSTKRLEVSRADAEAGTVTIVTDAPSGQFVLSGDTLQQLRAINPKLTLIIGTARGTIVVPSAALEGRSGDVTIQIRVRADQPQSQAVLAAALDEQRSGILSDAVQFSVAFTDNSGKQTKVERFPSYVERRIVLGTTKVPATAAGVQWDAKEQRFLAVPTRFVNENGATVAIMQSQGTGTYLILDHPVVFGDMPGHWAKKAAELLASKGIVQGRGEDRFDPSGGLTRAETAALLVRALGIEAASGSGPFADTQGKWYEQPVAAASQAGLVTGYADGSFRPNAKVTREELAVMIGRAIAYAGVGNQLSSAADQHLSDENRISAWAREAVKQAAASGIVEGDSAGNFRPQDTATRAEMAVMLLRMLEQLNFI